MSGRAFIPYGHQCVDDSDIEAVVRVLRGDWLTGGPNVASFERAFADYVGARHAVSFANGTAALHAAMSAAGVGEGDGVVVPPITFAATSNAAVYMGGVPIFADISPDTWCLDAEKAELAADEAGRPIRAIVPVSYTGYPVDIDQYRAAAKKHGATIIEDASHTLGGSRGGAKVGAQADMTTFSFHPVKSITTMEGGMVTTDSDELAEHLRLFVSHGITKDPKKFGRPSDGAWDNDMTALGYNYRLTDVACALGNSQLKRADQFVSRRRQIAARYRKELADVPGLKMPPSHPGHAYHLFAIQVPAERRREIFDELRAAGIGVQVHYIPVYRHSWYREHFPQDAKDLPVSEQVSASEISIPIYPSLTDDDQSYVIDKIKEAIR